MSTLKSSGFLPTMIFLKKIVFVTDLVNGHDELEVNGKKLQAETAGSSKQLTPTREYCGGLLKMGFGSCGTDLDFKLQCNKSPFFLSLLEPN